MEGIQFSFYACPEDHADIEEWLSELDVSFIDPPIESETPQFVRRLKPIGHPDREAIIYVVPKSFSENVRIEFEYGKYRIAEPDSPVITYYRGYVDAERKVMTPASLYAYIYTWNKTDFIAKRKDEAFVREVQRIYRYVKKRLHKLKPGLYAAARALRKREQDGWQIG